MSEMPQTTKVPEWTLGDRMSKALNVSGISVGEISEYLGLSRNSVSAYINDRQTPKRQTVLLWAMRTGVSIEWLETGSEAGGGPNGPGTGERQADEKLARLTRQKQARATGTTIRRYLPASAQAA